MNDFGSTVGAARGSQGAGSVLWRALAAAMPAQAATATPRKAAKSGAASTGPRRATFPLWMFRKRIGAPKAGEPARPVVFFVHGSSVTSRVFDLNVPGKGEYSV